MTMTYRHEQRLIAEVPVGGRFLHRMEFSQRRYYVVLKHYDGYQMESILVDDKVVRRKAPGVEYPGVELSTYLATKKRHSITLR